MRALAKRIESLEVGCHQDGLQVTVYSWQADGEYRSAKLGPGATFERCKNEQELTFLTRVLTAASNPGGVVAFRSIWLLRDGESCVDGQEMDRHLFNASGEVRRLFRDVIRLRECAV